MYSTYFGIWSLRVNCAWIIVTLRSFVRSPAAANSCALKKASMARVAVGMEVQRDAQVVDLLDHLVDDVLRERQLAAPVLLAAGAAGQVGRGEEGGPALRRAVDRDLDAADLEALVVLAPLGHRELREDLVHVGDEGVGDHVDDVGPGLRGALHRLQLRQVRRPFMGGGDAGLRVEHLARLGRTRSPAPASSAPTVRTPGGRRVSMIRP